MYKKEAVLQELSFKAVRSSGSGGQHVNKVSSKVELYFNLEQSSSFNDNQKSQLYKKLCHKLTKDNILILQCGESRSQHKNKEIIIQRLFSIIDAALLVPKKRIKTKIPKSVIRKRLKNKRHLSDKKGNRKRPEIE